MKTVSKKGEGIPHTPALPLNGETVGTQKTIDGKKDLVEKVIPLVQERAMDLATCKDGIDTLKEREKEMTAALINVLKKNKRSTVKCKTESQSYVFDLHSMEKFTTKKMVEKT